MAGKDAPKGQLSKAEIEVLNKKYIGGIKEIILDRKVEEIRDEKGIKKERVIKPGVAFYLRKPDRATLKYASSKAMKMDGIDLNTAGEVILKKCFVAGDEEVKNLDFYFFRACMECYTYMQELMGFV